MSFERHPEATALFQFSSAVVVSPGATIWTSDFSSWPDALTRNLFTPRATAGRNGTAGAEWSRTTAGTTVVGTLTGLVVGRQYRLSLWVKVTTGAPTFRLTVAGVNSSATATTSYVQQSVAFTAAATSHNISFYTSAAATFYVDDMALELLPVSSTTATFPISDGSLSLDKARYPFGTSDVTVPLMSTGILEALNPFTYPRVKLTCTAENDPRTFDLVMRRRVVDHAARTVRLDLATDEAILQAYSKLTDDQGAFTRQDSLRSIINYVLGQAIPGAALQTTGAADRAFRVLSDATNMLPDPRYARTPDGGYGIVNASTIPDTTWTGPENVWGVHLYNPTSDDAFVQLTNNAGLPYGMQVGRTYVFSATGSARSAMGGSEQVLRSRRLVAIGRVNGTYQDLSRSAAVPNVVDNGTRVSTEFTIPAGCDQILLRAYHGHTSGTITWRSFRLSESDFFGGTHNSEYIDGARTNTAEYAYSWDGAADASTSKRIALISRAPQILSWRAGRSAWDFLSGITDAAGLRLWCDEQRRWWLVDPKEYKVPGRLSVRVDNATDGTDTMDFSGGDAPTGVIARFTWRDTDGQSKTKDDFAGSPGRVLVEELDRPYPGPGTAALILTGMTNRGRTQAVTVASDMTATPGEEISISLPGTLDQLGQLQAVRWNLTEGVMDLESSGLTEVTPNSWLAGYAERTWPQAPDADTWASLT
ncbi:hypothetical protein [Microbacterium sp. 22296]|uniref:hypothetical protein n=1 Tax=Microbacterium sp. 22296 TaxID=3453903 RepID=UPI003F84771A